MSLYLATTESALGSATHILMYIRNTYYSITDVVVNHLLASTVSAQIFDRLLNSLLKHVGQVISRPIESRVAKRITVFGCSMKSESKEIIVLLRQLCKRL